MFAELVCRETTPVKWHDGASISEGISMYQRDGFASMMAGDGAILDRAAGLYKVYLPTA